MTQVAPPRGSLVTAPNAVTCVRILCVPLFAWLIATGADKAAVVVLVVAGVSDWLDGFLARTLGSHSDIGRLLDPISDRLFIGTAAGVLALRDAMDWWVIAVLLLRDACVAASILALRRFALPPAQVTYVGKVATFCLLASLPFILLGHDEALVPWCRPIGWAFAWWGLGLHLWSGIGYLYQGYRMIAAARTPRGVLHP